MPAGCITIQLGMPEDALELVLPKILEELRRVLSLVRQEEIDTLVKALAEASRVFVFGAGRVGTASRALAMRLAQMGKPAFWVPDDTTPRIGAGDLLVANSGSGGSPSTLHVASLARKAGAAVATITANPQGEIARVASTVLVLPAQTFKTDRSGWSSVLPMGSQFELGLWILQDILCLRLMGELGLDEAALIARHRNLE
jgi:6-phospho-3-hexuloisomerase